MSTGNSTSKSMPQACLKEETNMSHFFLLWALLGHDKSLCFFSLPGKSSLLFQEMYDSHSGLPSSFDHLLENQLQRSLKLSFLEKVSSSNTKEACQHDLQVSFGNKKNNLQRNILKGFLHWVCCFIITAHSLCYLQDSHLVCGRNEANLSHMETCFQVSFPFPRKRSKLSNSLNLTIRNERKMVVAPSYPIIRTIRSSERYPKSDSASDQTNLPEPFLSLYTQCWQSEDNQEHYCWGISWL